MSGGFKKCFRLKQFLKSPRVVFKTWLLPRAQPGSVNLTDNRESGFYFVTSVNDTDHRTESDIIFS